MTNLKLTLAALALMAATLTSAATADDTKTGCEMCPPLAASAPIMLDAMEEAEEALWELKPVIISSLKKDSRNDNLQDMLELTEDLAGTLAEVRKDSGEAHLDYIIISMEPLAGAKAKEAFFVRCDRSTMTQNSSSGSRAVYLKYKLDRCFVTAAKDGYRFDDSALQILEKAEEEIYDSIDWDGRVLTYTGLE